MGPPCWTHTTPPPRHRFNFPGPTPRHLGDSDSVTLHSEDISRNNEPLTCGSHITCVPHVSDSMSREITPSNVTESVSPPCTPPAFKGWRGALSLAVPRSRAVLTSAHPFLAITLSPLYPPPLSSTTPTKSSFARLSSPGSLWRLRDPSMRFQRRCSSTSLPTSRPRPASP